MGYVQRGAAAVLINARKDKRGWYTALLLLGAFGIVVFQFWNSLWASSIDLALHYALAARITEYGHAPTTVDDTLGIMNGYPTLSHSVAAALGMVPGSVLAGLQLTVLISLTAVWSGIALMLMSVPERRQLVALVCALAVFGLNRWRLHLELFGNEVLWNFFFAQLTAQAAAILALAGALLMERRQIGRALRYVTLAASIPVIAQIHPVPALEVLGVLCLMLALDLRASATEGRRPRLLFGLCVIAVTLAGIVLNPTFITFTRISQNNGVLNLIYTSTPASLALESGLVIAVSAAILIRWLRLEGGGQRGFLILKYSGLLGVTIAGLCLIQVVTLAFGLGSLYAVKKYAYGMNTLLLIDIPLLVASHRYHAADPESPRGGWAAALIQPGLTAVLVVAAIFAVMPQASTRMGSVQDILSLERFAGTYRQANPGSSSGRYDYAAGLFRPDPAVDYMVTIGILKTPQDRNVDDIFGGRLPSRPRSVGRIFTSIGSPRWDIPACRMLVKPEGYAILDGPCVMATLGARSP
jgi:hypothetical protein